MNILDTVTKDENLKIAVVKLNDNGYKYNCKFYPKVIKNVKKGDVIAVLDKDGDTNLGTVCKIKKHADDAPYWVVGRINVKKAKQNYYKQEHMLFNVDGE